jgi:hypothetical protein
MICMYSEGLAKLSGELKKTSILFMRIAMITDHVLLG